MPELKEIINVPPKRRITIPIDHVAIVIHDQLYDEVLSLCKIIRRGKKLSAEEKKELHDVAGNLLLALIEVE